MSKKSRTGFLGDLPLVLDEPSLYIVTKYKKI